VVYDTIVIYYFSGTGNALKAAEWIEEKANEFGIEVHKHSINRFENVTRPEVKNKTLILFCYPTHGFNLAPLMMKYIAKFPKGKSDVALINTRGGLKFGRIYFPGISGVAQLLPMLLLLIKGYKIKGSLPFDMPSNWISVHPGLTDSAIRDITERRKFQLQKFAERLFEKGKVFNYKFFVYMPIDIAVAPIAIGYYFCGRFMFAKSFYASANCDDCKLCIEKCPTNSIILLNNRPYWKYSCESCMRCIGICPKKSIQTAHSFIIPMMYLYSLMPVVAAAMNILKLSEGSVIQIILSYIINWTTVFIFLVSGYFIFSQLLRIKFINRFFEYTSLTRYWRRYIAAGIKGKDFGR